MQNEAVDVGTQGLPQCSLARYRAAQGQCRVASGGGEGEVGVRRFTVHPRRATISQSKLPSSFFSNSSSGIIVSASGTIGASVAAAS